MMMIDLIIIGNKRQSVQSAFCSCDARSLLSFFEMAKSDFHVCMPMSLLCLFFLMSYYLNGNLTW